MLSTDPVLGLASGKMCVDPLSNQSIDSLRTLPWTEQGMQMQHIPAISNFSLKSSLSKTHC